MTPTCETCCRWRYVSESDTYQCHVNGERIELHDEACYFYVEDVEE